MKNRKLFTSKGMTVGLTAAAIAALVLSGVTGARAALTYYSETYTSHAELHDIGVTLLEKSNGAGEYTDVAHRDYEGDGAWDETATELLTGIEDNIVPGKEYKEELAVENTGSIDQYVRVTIRKYWVKGEDEVKDQTLSPDLIDLNFLTSNGWQIDEASSTDERTVLYYSDKLEPGDVSNPLCDTLTINGDIAKKVTQDREVTDEGTRITTKYAYDGVQFKLEARVDAIQSHNADDAAVSAWGQNFANFSE